MWPLGQGQVRRPGVAPGHGKKMPQSFFLANLLSERDERECTELPKQEPYSLGRTVIAADVCGVTKDPFAVTEGQQAVGDGGLPDLGVMVDAKVRERGEDNFTYTKGKVLERSTCQSVNEHEPVKEIIIWTLRMQHLYFGA